MSDAIQSDEELKRRVLFVPCKDKQALHDWIDLFLDMDIPDSIIDETSNCSPMDMIYETYSHALKNDDPEFSRVLYYASREAMKTLSSSIIECLALLHLGRDCIHLAAILAQSKKAQEYVKKFFRAPVLRDYVVGDNSTEIVVVRYHNPETGDNLPQKEFMRLSEEEKALYTEKTQYIRIIVATLASTNSQHAEMLLIDEVDVLANPAAYEEAKMVPSPKNGNMPITVLTSTRKFSFGLVQKEIDDASNTGLKIRHWNIIDVTEQCPTTRHRPDMPHLPIYRSDETLKSLSEEEYAGLDPEKQKLYVKDKGYYGCIKNCKLFAMCRCRLADVQKSKSKLLKPIDHVINQFKIVSGPAAKAQLLCWKPSTEGLIYPRLDRSIHCLSPAAIHEMVFGEPPLLNPYTKENLLDDVKGYEVKWFAGVDFGYTHNFVVVLGFVYGANCYIVDCQAVAELEPGQQIELMESKIKKYEPAIFADTENPQMIKTMKRAGFRMKEWKKYKGSVIGGIDVVRMKLQPAVGEPQLFFLEGDEGVEFLVKRMSAYHWMLDAAGKPTNVPDDKEDDECDAIRYLIMNVFGSRGRLIVTEDQPNTKPEPVVEGYTEDNWMSKVISERTGDVAVSLDEAEAKKEPPSGKKGSLKWSF